jgi:hypothetical protein
MQLFIFAYEIPIPKPYFLYTYCTLLLQFYYQLRQQKYTCKSNCKHNVVLLQVFPDRTSKYFFLCIFPLPNDYNFLGIPISSFLYHVLSNLLRSLQNLSPFLHYFYGQKGCDSLSHETHFG